MTRARETLSARTISTPHHYGMTTPQGGIFALGTASHAYLEFDAVAAEEEPKLLTAIASLRL